MNIFSFTVLEDTLNELAAKQIQPDGNARQDECVTAIRACMELIALHPTNETYTDKIRHALSELACIARQNGEFLIAARIRTVAHQLAVDEGFSKRNAVRVAQLNS